MKLLISKQVNETHGIHYFPDNFQRTLFAADAVKIATGYVSIDSIVELTGVIEQNPDHFKSFHLWIGMPGWDSVQTRKAAAEVLDSKLKERALGRVHLVRDWPFHGKIYYFEKDSIPLSATVGSSNLSAILDNHWNLEVDVQIFEKDLLAKLSDFFLDILVPASCLLEEIPSSAEPFHPAQRDVYADLSELRLDVLKGVIKVSEDELRQIRTCLVEEKVFTHTLKSTPKSNLNAFHGKGRLQRPKGRAEYIKPRPWYEVELILSQKERESINSLPNLFTVVTDDGWSFEMKRQGDYLKNLRSVIDLRVFGRWIKGRLETADVLRPGDVVTKKTLETYGRHTLTFTPINDKSDRWFLDFSVTS